MYYLTENIRGRLGKVVGAIRSKFRLPSTDDPEQKAMAKEEPSIVKDDQRRKKYQRLTKQGQTDTQATFNVNRTHGTDQEGEN